MLRHFASLLFALAISPSGTAFAQDTSPLLGRWIGASEDVQGDILIIEQNAIVIDGERIPYRTHGPRTLVLGGEDGERAEWSIQGDMLTLTIEGESEKYRRDPKSGGGERRPGAGNPLGGRGIGKPAADPFARSFRGEAIELVLTGTAAAGYQGTLTVGGERYPTAAQANGNSLRGSFSVDGDRFEFTATLDGDRLTLVSDGETYRLTGERSADAPGQEQDAEKAPVDVPPALDGVYDGETQPFTHPRDWFTCELPKGWSVFSQDDSGMLINPGLTQTDTLDAIVFLMWGRLEPPDQNQPVAKVIEKYLPRMRDALAQQGITAGEPQEAIATYRSKEVPGAVVAFRGTTQQGQAVSVWIGGVVKQDAWLTVGAVTIDAKSGVYLPKVKRIFMSLAPKPPKRNPELEKALAGRTFSSTRDGKITGSLHSATYSFGAGGAVTRQMMSNVPSQPGLPGVSTDSERHGRYEVCGDAVYMYFESGQDTAQVVQQGGVVTGLRMGNVVYQ